MTTADAPSTRTADLLHLVDRAATGRLLPGEAALLRTGIRHLAAQLAGAGNGLRKVTAELAEARCELAAHSPMAVDCPYCGAPIGQRCRAMRGTVPPRTPHTARTHAATKETR